MIQFNLLPAVKREYVQTQHTKRLVILSASVVAAVSLLVLILLFVGVQIVQKKHSKDLSADIKEQSSKLEGVNDLNKILTIQNQMASLPELHDKKPVASRLFNYLKQVTPANVSIATVNVDFDAHTLTITGSADAISTVNKYVDTLKFTTYKTSDNTGTNAFSAVVLAGFGTDDKGASYNLRLNFDEKIFNSASEIVLTVPSKVTTRSQTEKPDSLFQPLSNQNGGTQ
jgi:Tfp pilus assembly protein PilN